MGRIWKKVEKVGEKLKKVGEKLNKKVEKSLDFFRLIFLSSSPDYSSPRSNVEGVLSSKVAETKTKTTKGRYRAARATKYITAAKNCCFSLSLSFISFAYLSQVPGFINPVNVETLKWENRKQRIPASDNHPPTKSKTNIKSLKHCHHIFCMEKGWKLISCIFSFWDDKSFQPCLFANRCHGLAIQCNDDSAQSIGHQFFRKKSTFFYIHHVF